MYPKGHVNVISAVIWAGGNQPLADAYETIEFLAEQTRRAQRKADRLSREAKSPKK